MLDEPFSALDVLVADTLRRELADLWQQHKIPTRAILMVTHNIDEAVRLADRLVVFHTDPGGIRVECAGLRLDQREEKKPAHIQLVDAIYQIMTNPKEDAEQLLAGARPAEGVVSPREGHLPEVTISGLTGFLHRLLALGGREDLHDLARDLRMGADHLLPLVDAANLLDLVDLAQGDVVLTAEGRRFAEASPPERRNLFRQQAVANVELLGQIMRRLEATPDHKLKDDAILDLLEQSFSPVEARRTLPTAINWGRYAGLFTYANGTFRLASAPT
jgi:NitT/TauT family transport system ATP-binding protein